MTGIESMGSFRKSYELYTDSQIRKNNMDEHKEHKENKEKR